MKKIDKYGNKEGNRVIFQQVARIKKITKKDNEFIYILLVGKKEVKTTIGKIRKYDQRIGIYIDCDVPYSDYKSDNFGL